MDIKLTNSEELKGHMISETAPKKEGFLAVCNPSADLNTKYININHILYIKIPTDEINRELANNSTRIAEMIERCGVGIW
jgi:hypothetical protein